MKTQSKSIKTFLTTLLLTISISSIEAQQWTYDGKDFHEVKEKKENEIDRNKVCHKKHGNLTHHAYYMSPDSMMSDSVPFETMKKTYSFGFGEGPSIEIATQNAKKDLYGWPEEMRNTLIFFYNFENKDFKLVRRQTKIDRLGPKKYQVTIWARYEIIK